MSSLPEACQRAQATLFEAQENPAIQAELTPHLELCQPCRQSWEEACETSDALRAAASVVPPSADFVDGVLAALARAEAEEREPNLPISGEEAPVDLRGPTIFAAGAAALLLILTISLLPELIRGDKPTAPPSAVTAPKPHTETPPAPVLPEPPVALVALEAPVAPEISVAKAPSKHQALAQIAQKSPTKTNPKKAKADPKPKGKRHPGHRRRKKGSITSWRHRFLVMEERLAKSHARPGKKQPRRQRKLLRAIKQAHKDLGSRDFIAFLNKLESERETISPERRAIREELIRLGRQLSQP